jgi:hypothetical protein
MTAPVDGVVRVFFPDEPLVHRLSFGAVLEEVTLRLSSRVRAVVFHTFGNRPTPTACGAKPQTDPPKTESGQELD